MKRLSQLKDKQLDLYSKFLYNANYYLLGIIYSMSKNELKPCLEMQIYN